MEKILGKIVILLGTVTISFVLIHYVNFKLTLTGSESYFSEKVRQLDIINELRMRSLSIIDMRDITKQGTHMKTTISHIVLHHDNYPYGQDNSWDNVDEYHEGKGWGGIVYHYFVSRSGKVYQNHTDSANTPHAGSRKYNAVSISVCMQGNFETDTLQGEQKRSVIKLLYLLRRRYPDAILVGHREVRPEPTACPGRNIDLIKLKEASFQPHIKLLNYEH